MSTHFDLAVIGTGSGNSIPDARFADWRIAYLEEGVFGGTCLNVGCIPTKMYVYPADLADATEHAHRLGVDAHVDRVRWQEIRDRIFARIDPISANGREYRRAALASGGRLFEGHARFTDVHTLDTGTGETITADHIVIAAGSRPVLPEVEGLDAVPFHTSDTIMRVDEVPRRLLILGGGFVAAEFAHIFSAFGSQVTVANRSARLLRAEDVEVSARFTELAQQSWDVRLNTVVRKLEAYDGGLRAFLDEDGTETTLEFDTLLVATGRRSNSDGLALDRAGVEVDDDGLVVVDHHQRTTAAGVWALGDVSSPHQLKHVANHEARVVQHNLLHPDAMVRAMRDYVPSAVFSRPQVASVGMTEEDAVRAGVTFVTAREAYGDTAYGWAMEDTTSFAKLLADPETGLLLGAHLIGPQAANLIQPLIQAMSAGQRVQDVARGQYWIHPALMEVVENALLALDLP